MNWRSFLTFSALLVAACSGGGDGESSGSGSDDGDAADVDSDGDGLSDSEEEELGLDPDSDDSDGDGLLDKEELDQGLDPLSPDTDGDGYRDIDELTEGKDPLDANSVIYEGGWPYAASKSDLDPSTVPEIAAEGELFLNFTAKDQYGQEVQLWDFKNDENKYVIVDVSAEWCGPCNTLALWLDGGQDYYDLEPEYGVVREAVDNGDAYWVTILAEDRNYDPANRLAVNRWFEEYPHPMVPVFPDNDYEATTFMDIGGYPTLIVLKPDMTVSWKGGRFASWEKALAHLKKKL